MLEEIAGDTFVDKVRVSNVKTKKKTVLDISGVFMAVGFRPNTGYLKGIVKLDDIGTIIINEKMETSVHGIFAAGDIRSNSIRQIIAAAGDGAVAAIGAERYISE